MDEKDRHAPGAAGKNPDEAITEDASIPAGEQRSEPEPGEAAAPAGEQASEAEPEADAASAGEETSGADTEEAAPANEGSEAEPEAGTSADEETSGAGTGDVAAPANEDTEAEPEAETTSTDEENAVAGAEVTSGEDRGSESETASTRLRAMVEAAVYITDDPLTAKQIAAALDQPANDVQEVLDALVAEYEHAAHGISIREVAEGYKMGTKPEHHEAMRSFVKKLQKPLKLSMAALETLAVIAYRQPITAPEIMEIRGVQGAGVLKTLLDRKLIATAGRKNVIGKPMLYKTTKDFLVQFGLKNLKELPTLKEFEELARVALADAEEPEPDKPAEQPRELPFAETGDEAEPAADESRESPAEQADEDDERAESKGPQSEESEPEAGDGENKRLASPED